MVHPNRSPRIVRFRCRATCWPSPTPCMLQQLRDGDFPRTESGHSFDPCLDLNRVVFRTDCAATPLLVAFAAQLDQISSDARIRALVADDFQPSIVHNESYLGPRLNRIEATSAAAIRCIWLRVLSSLFQRTVGLSTSCSRRGHRTLVEPTMTSRGMRPAIMTRALVPPSQSQMAPQVVERAHQDLGRSPTGEDIQRWLYGDAFLRLGSLR